MTAASESTRRHVGGAWGRVGRRKRRVAVSAVAMAMLAGTLLIVSTIGASGASTRSAARSTSSAASAAATAFRWGTVAWPGTISYNPFSPDFVADGSMALFGLASYSDHNRPGPNPYYPEIAQSWTLGKHSVTLHLQPNAIWQNGAALTASDVVTSLEVNGGEFNSVWADITGVSAPNPSTVVVDLQTWSPPATVLLKLFEMYVVPPVYGSFLPKGFESDLLTYWRIYNTLHPSVASLADATSSPAGKTISTVATNIVKYNPPTLVGNGAYKVVSASVSGILYQKWSGFYDAKAITAPYVEIYPMSDAVQYGALESGRIDFQDDQQFTDPNVKALDSSAYGHYVFFPSAVQQESLVLHLADYPLGILAVRKALEYVINRPKLTQLDMGGTLIQDPPAQHPDGINHYEAAQYLTPRQFASLNSYAYNPKEAASLLKGAGFTKKGGTWYTPKGTVFSLTISEPAQVSQFVTDGIVIADELTAFGIHATSVDVNQATYSSQQLAGDYAISENYMDWGFGTPMGDFAATFGETTLPAYNYPVTYSGVGKFNGSVAIGMPPIENVPGLGKVNIAQALNDEVNSALPSQYSTYTYDWARWFNQNLPLLTLYNNAFHEAYGTARYTDFPPLSASWLWTNLSDVGQPVVWMQAGYLKLK